MSGEAASLLHQLVGFHAREDKPDRRQFFERLGQDDGTLYADAECLVGVRRSGEPYKVGRWLKQAYAFDPDQPLKGKWRPSHPFGRAR